MEGKGRAIVSLKSRDRERMKRSSSDAVSYPTALDNMGYFSSDLF